MEISIEQYNRMAERLTELEYLLAERKTGKWTKIYPDKRGYTYHFECSNCHCYTLMHNLETDIDYDYCPNCGARMVEGGQDG